MREFDGMCGHDDGLIMEVILDSFLHDVSSDVDIDSTDDVVKEVDITIWVKRSSEVNSEFLSAWEIYAVLSNLGIDAVREQLHIVF